MVSPGGFVPLEARIRPGRTGLLRAVYSPSWGRTATVSGLLTMPRMLAWRRSDGDGPARAMAVFGIARTTASQW